MVKDYDISIIADKSVTKNNLLEDLENFYPLEKQKQYGVLGIKFELIK